MKRNVTAALLIVLLLCGCLRTLGQKPDDEISKSVRANNIITSFSQFNQRLPVGQILTGMSTPSVSEIVGNPYWDTHWGKSSLLLYKNDELVEGYVTRYDIYKDEFEFRLTNDVRVMSGSKVKNVVWIDSVTNKPRYLINGREYKEDGAPLSGFVEVLVEAKVALFKHIKIEVLKPDFNPALNVGSKDTRILKKESFYFNSGESLIRIKSKKSLDALGSKYEQRINQFMKTNNIKLNNESDLVRLFQFLAST
ncbi:MAG: hypothetical protein JNK44_07315 [Cyclobacteriaceae bacterium]|nr:hypothetical protein [Cyclobacteriaceae bacterium]